MTEKQAYLELYNVLNQIGVFKVLKRLGLSGSGAESCPGDAQRSGQDAAEERSREGGRVQSAALHDPVVPQPKPFTVRPDGPTAKGASGRLDARAVTPGAIESEHETKQPG